jgi:plasmid stabilization system protein ParE
MAFRVEITEEAQRDIVSILDWLIAEQAAETGLQWFQRLEKAIASLSELPQRCPIAPESERFPFEVRHLLYGRKPHVYRVIFMMEGFAGHVFHHVKIDVALMAEIINAHDVRMVQCGGRSRFAEKAPFAFHVEGKCGKQGLQCDIAV